MNRSLEQQALADPAALAPVEAPTRGLPAALASAARARPARARKSRWPARLDLLQSASGLFLALFLVAHMFFVSSILISHDTFYTVARFFEAGWLFGTPQPWVVSCVVGGVLAVFVLHAWLAMRKFPANFRQYKVFAAHKAQLRHSDTGLWWIQLWTGFALFFLALGLVTLLAYVQLGIAHADRAGEPYLPGAVPAGAASGVQAAASLGGR